MESPVESKNAVNLAEIVTNEKTYLQFDFKDHLDSDNAQKAIVQWKDKMKPGTKRHLIYNCMFMTGFDTSARKTWQTTMGTHKHQIGDIWIISSNVFILGAAKTMGLLTGFAIKVAKTLNDIKD